MFRVAVHTRPSWERQRAAASRPLTLKLTSISDDDVLEQVRVAHPLGLLFTRRSSRPKQQVVRVRVRCNPSSPSAETALCTHDAFCSSLFLCFFSFPSCSMLQRPSDDYCCSRDTASEREMDVCSPPVQAQTRPSLQLRVDGEGRGYADGNLEGSL